MNLLSNAFKFTDSGGVSLTVKSVTGGWSADNASLAAADRAIAFEIMDSGIGISPEHQKSIFEAFQQADGTISRRSEEHTSELQSLMRRSYAVFCLKKKT